MVRYLGNEWSPEAFDAGIIDIGPARRLATTCAAPIRIAVTTVTATAANTAPPGLVTANVGTSLPGIATAGMNAPTSPSQLPAMLDRWTRTRPRRAATTPTT